MKKLICTTVLLAVSLVGCGEDPRLEKLEENAPTLMSKVSDQEALDLLDWVCTHEGEVPPFPPSVPQEEQGYALGLAISTCE